MKTEITALDTAVLRLAYARGETNPLLAAQAYLARIRQRDSQLHAFIHVCDELAVQQAKESTQRWDRGEPLGPLDGMMLTLKDNIDVAGLPCTAGTAAFAQRRPDRDASLYRRLRDAGMVLLGKVTMHEAALGATTDNPVYGRCINPMGEGLSPGGSSGGSAAAVADHLCHVSVGTDTMGSVRIPAAYCGVMGFIPTRARLAMDGVIPLSPLLDAAGPLARSGHDLVQAAACLLGMPSPLSSAHTVWNSLRVGIVAQADQVAMASEVRRAWQDTQRVLEARGAQLCTVDFPGWSPATARQSAFLLSEWQGADYWFGALGPGLSGLSPDLQQMLRYGAGIAQEKRSRILGLLEDLRMQSHSIFSGLDVLLLPTTPDTAIPHGAPVPVHQADFSCLANIWGTPALSFPCPTAGLPVSCQFLAPSGHDERLLSIALALDSLWH